MPEPAPVPVDLVDSLADALGAVLDHSVDRDLPIGPLCTYKVGGAAAVAVTAESVDELGLVARELKRCDPGAEMPVLVIGKGSNLLVADRGFAGLLIRLGNAFSGIAVDVERARVVAGGMALLPVVARRTAAAGLTGFEWAVGVPGSIGGAVRMNAGGHGSDMAASLVSATVVDLRGGGEPVRVDVSELDLGYRHSAIAPEQVVVDAELELAPGDRERSEAEISEIVTWRRANQPGGQNAGSVFANPPGDSAGRLIDSLGLKGFRIGSASVSGKHANFIQADPGGSADDVRAVVAEVARRVEAATGIVLRAENLLIGFDPVPGTEAVDMMEVDR